MNNITDKVIPTYNLITDQMLKVTSRHDINHMWVPNLENV